MKVELLYFDECASWENGLKNLETELQKEGLGASVRLIKIKNDEAAARLRFLGSPSFRVNDEELWPEERGLFALSCRIYSTPEGMKGWPSVEMLQEKLHVMKERSI